MAAKKENVIVKNIPLAIQDVLQAFVNGGMARQNRSGLPR